MTARTCRQCPTPLPVGAHHRVTFCSHECRLASRRRAPQIRVVGVCATCSAGFTSNRVNARFCSFRCKTLSSSRRAAEGNRSARMIKTYGMDSGEYEGRLAEQLGTCAICHEGPGVRRLAVDHDHVTGAVRGLLCCKCNTALGHLREDPHLFDMAKLYLTGVRIFGSNHLAAA